MAGSEDEEYQPRAEYEALSAPLFLRQLEGLDDATPLMWRSHRDEEAHEGIWLRHGAYKLKHGSFIDPVDLACYGAQFYVADEAGRHECLQIGHGTEGPEDAVVLAELGELRRALAPYLGEDDAGDVAAFEGAQASQDEGVVAAEGGGEGQGAIQAQPSSDASGAPALKVLQPDGAFEMHGALTKGWRAVRYDLMAEGEVVDTVLVFD